MKKLCKLLGAVALLSVTANADVIYHDIDDLEFWTGNAETTLEIDMDQDGTAEFTVENPLVDDGSGGSERTGEATITFINDSYKIVTVGGRYEASNIKSLDAGTTIDSATINEGFFWAKPSAVIFDSTGTATPFIDQTDTYIGVQFPIEGVIHYGWVKVWWYAGQKGLYVKELAYESVPGVAIIAGDDGTPTPVTQAPVRMQSSWNIQKSGHSLSLSNLSQSLSGTVQVVSMSGRVVMTQSFSNGAVTIDMGGLSKGNYLLSISDGVQAVQVLKVRR